MFVVEASSNQEQSSAVSQDVTLRENEHGQNKNFLKRRKLTDLVNMEGRLSGDTTSGHRGRPGVWVHLTLNIFNLQMRKLDKGQSSSKNTYLYKNVLRAGLDPSNRRLDEAL